MSDEKTSIHRVPRSTDETSPDFRPRLLLLG